MKAVVLSIGSELTSGHALDTNSAWLSVRLAENGIEVLRHESIPDDEPPIAEAMKRAAQSAELVLVTGGLGPTEDDRTRHALARALDVELAEDAESWRRIEAYFAERSYTLTPGNRRQALVPVGASAIPNSCGTAPGLRARLGGAQVFCLPGVPSEMRTMFAESVLPVARDSSSGRVIRSRTLLTFGKTESAIGESLADMMAADRNPQIGTRASDAVIGIRVTAGAEDGDACDALLSGDVEEIRRRLGAAIFGEEPDTLAGAVGRLLVERGKTLAVAESCTGGLLAKMLTDVPGSSEYFVEGLVTYANRAKQRLLEVPPEMIERHGAVSAEVAEAMALGCRSVSGTDLAISITGIAGPGGATANKPIGLVFVALADDRGARVRELRLGPQLSRDSVRVRSCRIALHLLRRRLLRTAK